MNLSEEDTRKIIEWAGRHPEIKKVYLFGSRARGNNHPKSDIDLAIEMEFLEWFDWHPKYKENPDLHLSHEVRLDWYERGAGLEIIEPAVVEDGILLYSVEE